MLPTYYCCSRRLAAKSDYADFTDLARIKNEEKSHSTVKYILNRIMMFFSPNYQYRAKEHTRNLLFSDSTVQNDYLVNFIELKMHALPDDKWRFTVEYDEVNSSLTLKIDLSQHTDEAENASESGENEMPLKIEKSVSVTLDEWRKLKGDWPTYFAMDTETKVDNHRAASVSSESSASSTLAVNTKTEPIARMPAEPHHSIYDENLSPEMSELFSYLVMPKPKESSKVLPAPQVSKKGSETVEVNSTDSSSHEANDESYTSKLEDTEVIQLFHRVKNKAKPNEKQRYECRYDAECCKLTLAVHCHQDYQRAAFNPRYTQVRRSQSRIGSQQQRIALMDTQKRKWAIEGVSPLQMHKWINSGVLKFEDVDGLQSANELFVAQLKTVEREFVQPVIDKSNTEENQILTDLANSFAKEFADSYDGVLSPEAIKKHIENLVLVENPDLAWLRGIIKIHLGEEEVAQAIYRAVSKKERCNLSHVELEPLRRLGSKLFILFASFYDSEKSDSKPVQLTQKFMKFNNEKHEKLKQGQINACANAMLSLKNKQTIKELMILFPQCGDVNDQALIEIVRRELTTGFHFVSDETDDAVDITEDVYAAWEKLSATSE